MDRDIITAFSSVNKRLDKLAEGQDDLAKGQGHLTGHVDGLTKGQAKHDAAFAGVNSRLHSVEAVLVKLAEGQVKHDVAITKLEAVAIRTAGQLNTLAGEVAELAHAQQRTEATVQQLGVDVRQLTDTVQHLGQRMDQLGDRMDGYGQAVLRGLSEAVRRDADLDARVTALEQKSQ